MGNGISKAICSYSLKVNSNIENYFFYKKNVKILFVNNYFECLLIRNKNNWILPAKMNSKGYLKDIVVDIWTKQVNIIPVKWNLEKILFFNNELYVYMTTENWGHQDICPNLKWAWVNLHFLHL